MSCAAAFLGDAAGAGAGRRRVADRAPASERVAAHPDGAILVAASDGKRLITGGDDGRVVATDAGGAHRDDRR